MKNTVKIMKGSETIEINRSQITLNPYNPKRHTDEQVRQQVRNIKKNGYLGGIVWNKTTGNLIDGHRRVQALDYINKYNGENDYAIKVESVDFDEKTEKEQMTYMALGNSQADYNLVAQYIDDIDMRSVGLSQADIDTINTLAQSLKTTFDSGIEDLGTAFITPVPMYSLPKEEKTFDDIANDRELSTHESAEQIKEKKERNLNVAIERNEKNTLYIMLKFETAETVQEFCDMFGYQYEPSLIVSGEDLLERL